MKLTRTALAATAGLLLACDTLPAEKRAPKPKQEQPMHTLSNEFVRLDFAPRLGGRVMNYQLGEHRFFWTNPQLAGTVPPPSRLGPDGVWLNWGGDKLWPAPQGWDNDRQWPGPPDPVLDGGPYQASALRVDGQDAIHLVSPPDPRTGVQLGRTIRLTPGSSRVAIVATMKNISTHVTRWGIWSVTQLNAGKADGGGWNPLSSSYIPLNSASKYPKGYRILFGSSENAQFQTINNGGLLRMRYGWEVGKVAVDADQGWLANVDGSTGFLFVQRFHFQKAAEYPDGASVELWTNGLGRIHAWGKDVEMSRDPVENPYIVESEVLSPFAELQPGQESHFAYDWYSGNVGGEYPVLACTEAGCTSEPFLASRTGVNLTLRGRFGVFYTGDATLEFIDAQGRLLATRNLGKPLSPLHALILDGTRIGAPAHAVHVRLGVRTAGSRDMLRLAEADID